MDLVSCVHSDGTNSSGLEFQKQEQFPPEMETNNVRPSKRQRLKRQGSDERYRKRIVLKSGYCNIRQKNLHHFWMKFLHDPCTTLVDLQWRWSLLIFALSYILTWLGFTIFWWLIAIVHDDLDEMHMPERQEEVGWIPCYTNLKDFTSSFLFSLEVQTTLGYSIRMVTDECPEAIFLVIFQFIFGMVHTAYIVGCLYSKVTRTKYRTSTVMFSRKAVITQRDDDFYLMFRVGDLHKSNIIGAKIRAQLVRPRTSREGEIFNVYCSELKLGMDDCDANLFFMWPMIITHKIDEHSPLFDVSADGLFYEKFEIVVILEGTSEICGHLMQARTSYLSDEITWGRRFVPIIQYLDYRRQFEADYSRFNETAVTSVPLCSAKQWKQLRQEFGSTGSTPIWSEAQKRQKQDKPAVVRGL